MPDENKLNNQITHGVRGESVTKEKDNIIDVITNNNDNVIFKHANIYQEIFEKSADAILLIENGKFIDCNQATLKLLKYKSKSDLLQKSPYELSPLLQPDGKDSVKKAEEMIQMAIDKGSHCFEWNHLRADGKIIPVEVLLTPINIDKHSQIILATWREISEKKKQNKLQTALFNISEEASKATSIKEFYKSLHNIIKELMPAKNFYIAVYNSKKNTISFPYHVDEFDSTPETQPFGNGLTEYVIRTKKSQIITAEKDLELQRKGEVGLSGESAKVWVGIYLDFEGIYKGVLVLQSYDNENAYDEESLKVLEFVSQHIVKVLDKELADVRLRKSLMELSEAKEKAEKADKLKSNFLTQLSHEIRTPINAMLSLASLIKEDLEDKVDDEMKMSFQLMNKAGMRIIRTVDLLINLSEIQTGSYEVIKKEFDLYADVLEKVITEYKNNFSDKDIIMVTEVNTKNTKINADYYTVEQIFTHLIDNAVKYTDKGKIDVRIFRDELSNLAVEVSDTGIGIAEEYLPNLFNAFSQEEEGYTRKYDGNGIGLALVKHYCEMNNASIKVESKKGIGSTFKVVFPKENVLTIS